MKRSISLMNPEHRACTAGLVHEACMIITGPNGLDLSQHLQQQQQRANS